MKKFLPAASAVLLLGLFLPVFFCMVFIGNHMDYNAEHKINVFFPNTVLLLFAILAFTVLGTGYFFLRKIPVNKRTIIGTILFTLVSCVLFYFIKTEISRGIAFFGGWDCGMVANSARWVFEGGDMGYDNYYQIYSNNVPITWILYVLYKFVNSLGNYPYDPEFIWVQFQCLMFSATVFFAVMTVLIVSRKIAPAIVSLLVCLLFFGLCPWQIVPYTDAGSVAFSALTVCLYALFRHVKSGYRYLFWLLLTFAGMLGGILKATCYIAFIAVVMVEFAWLLSEKEKAFKKIRKLTNRVILLAFGILLALWCRSGMYKALDYVPDYDLEMTWTNYFYMGLNELTTGAGSGDGYIIAQSYADYPRRYRQQIELYYAKERIMEEKGGIPGTLDFWLRKQVMNFNDGTFGWFQEGWFNAAEYEKLGDSLCKWFLRDFYWQDGAYYEAYCTISQGIWIFVLLGVVLEAVSVLIHALRSKGDAEELLLRTVLIILNSLLGVVTTPDIYHVLATYIEE